VKATQRPHDLGQSIWLDNITRGLLTKGTLRLYITELSVMGLTSKVGYSKLREEIWP
jgi:transaldolase